MPDKSKLQLRKYKMIASNKHYNQPDLLIKVKEKVESMGLSLHLRVQKYSFEILTNNYKLFLIAALNPIMIREKQYFHITTSGIPAGIDFIVCFCRNNNKRSIYYIIPRQVIPKHEIYLLSEAVSDENEYAVFKEAWHLLSKKKTRKGGVMKAKESKQFFKARDIYAVQPVKKSNSEPGRINLGSYLNQKNSLGDRVKAEINRRLNSYA
jgi:hypothetical protein